MIKPYNKNLKLPSRDLRSNMTDAEQLLWSRLRRKQILGLQFYRQKPLLNYIVDFYCERAKLAIELDGAQHYEPEEAAYDQARSEALGRVGVAVLRFTNLQVDQNFAAVCEMIDRIVRERCLVREGR